MSDLYDFYRARRTILEMLEDRHYPVDPHAKELSFEEFSMFFEKKQIHFQVENDEGHVLYVFFYTDPKTFGKKEYSSFLEQVDSTKPSYSLMIVLREKLNTVMKRELEGELFLNTEFFLLHELQFNKTKHPIVPQHIRMTEEEKQEVMKHYSAKLSNMPVISRNDPIVRYYGGKPGEMFRIQRRSSAGLVIYYRVVK
jgi:DNA-directed RNA polymerases I, II, and III subunit RPABC1